MGKALVGLLIAAGVAALVFRLAAPHVLAGAKPEAGGPTAQNAPTDAAPPPGADAPRPPTTAQYPSAPIAPPRSEARKEAEEAERKRAPFYAWLAQEWKQWIEAARPSYSDPAVLEIFAAANSRNVAENIFFHVIRKHGKQYGFEKALIYAPAPSGGVERHVVLAEAALSRDGAWNLFYR